MTGGLHDLTALEQGALVRRREVSPVELVDHYLERVAGLDDVGAFVTVTPALARERAAALGVRPEGAGPLWGVPTAVKDLNPTAGVPTSFGSPVFAGLVPEESDGVVLSLEAAGTVSLGKTSTPELGSPCYTEPEGRPPAVTPWDRTRMAGGSSGGAAAAVAAGLVPVAQGSDGGGSIRIPASCCGLVGLKPTRGRISGWPSYGDPVGLATAGTLARDVRDAAALLDVMAGRRPGDPTWAPPPRGTFLAACDRDPGRLRVARFAAPVLADVDVDPECLRAWEDASLLLERLGHDVEDVAVPLPRAAVADFETCWAVLTALAPVPPEREHLLRPLTRWLAARGHAVSGPVFGTAVGAVRRHAATALEALAPYDLVLTPTLASPPLPVGAIRDDADPAADFDAQKAFTPWTSAWNVTGMPAVSLPLHQTAPLPDAPGGLPVGVMLAARPAEEELLLAVAAQLEAAAPWRDRRPPGW
ncbi:6-aminohexanoate-cyclic-dimer hydrolase [Nocardioides aquaticus]|uniref:6-aminohexanoate-cyclic-dimer hydrolase n=2 Tax=Nocardioides aquaticus TaxID=160826 RepID=A0ABX8EF69_9ACTN|nr:amidase [Nocardioides aquaticus]QVT78934.1 6-aminohexanoate-cyclic-dimer hydrolase [Nocardioides aquaticus]